ncbi:hypothetical protein Hanom_Chr09g00760011 [Helianthus anomalus]
MVGMQTSRDRARLTYESLGWIRALFSQARVRLVYYLLISILNKNKINNKLFRLASSISEAQARARLLNKLIFRSEIRL